MELLGVLPKEIWYLIVGDSGLVIKSLFLVSKHLNGLMEGIKKRFVFEYPIYEEPYFHNSYKGEYKYNLVETSTIFKHDNSVFNLRYNKNNYILNIPKKYYGKDMHESGFLNLRMWYALAIKIDGKLKYMINDNYLYDIDKIDIYQNMRTYRDVRCVKLNTGYDDLQVIRLLLECFGSNKNKVIDFLRTIP
jgi:hypothetical protein